MQFSPPTLIQPYLNSCTYTLDSEACAAAGLDLFLMSITKFKLFGKHMLG